MAKAVFQMDKEKQSPSAEGYKALRTNLVFAAQEQDCRMILLVSPQKDELAARFAVNLGVTMASGERKVLLVDGDLRTGALTKLLGSDKESSGLTGRGLCHGAAAHQRSPQGVQRAPGHPYGGTLFLL